MFPQELHTLKKPSSDISGGFVSLRSTKLRPRPERVAIAEPSLATHPPTLPDQPPSNGVLKRPVIESNLSSPTQRQSSLPLSASSSKAGPTPQSPESVVSSSTVSSSKPYKPRTIRTAEGTIFEVWRVADRPDAPIFGEEPKRLPDGSIQPRTKREAEEQLEVEWQKRRKLTIQKKVFERLEESVYGVAKSDMDGCFNFEGEPIPGWLNSEREFQDDGRLGTYVIRPSKEDFEQRWTEILEIMEPFGMRLGIIKCKIPEECLEPPLPYSEYLATNPTAMATPPIPKRKVGRPRKKTYQPRQTPLPQKDSNTTSPESTRLPEPPSSTTVPGMSQPPPSLPLTSPPPELMVYTMSQFLPLHTNSGHPHAPIYEVISKNKTLVPISTFPHNITVDSRNHRIPEETMLLRGRSWNDIENDNPGGEVYYSSDNDGTDALRSYLGLVNPNLARLAGNNMFDSTEFVIGIHTPYLYLGNPYTLFALHQEDYCALSLNFHHKGAPKMWRVTCPLDFDKVEELVRRTEDVLPGEKVCSQHVRHASIFLSRGALDLADVRSILVRQQQGEMIITWPLSYHQGWNEGSNICEAIAYGSTAWRDAFVGGEGGKMYRSCSKKCVARGMGAPIELQFN